MRLAHFLFTFLLFPLFFFHSQAQSVELDAKSFKETLKSEFTKITGTSNNSLSQGASLNTAEGSISVEYSFIPSNKENIDKYNKNFDLINVKLDGGSSDGLLNVFTNSKFNSNISISAKYQLINYSKSKMRVTEEDDGSIRKDDKGNIIISGYKVNWFSFGYLLKHQALNLLDSSETFANQVKNKNYISHEFSLGYNIYNWKGFDPWRYYFSTSVNYVYGNNSSLLNKVEVSEITNYGNDTDIRTSTKKYNALIGDYDEDIHNLNMAVDFYLFPFQKNSIALHLLPKYQIVENEKPIFNMDIGLLAPFTNKSDDKAVVNLELYYRFLDLGNSTKSSYRLFERNNIGLRVTFPINFKNI